ncbi:MAG: hypothetical protein ACRCXM_04355 [Beijerinckiaceae bacterium]
MTTQPTIHHLQEAMRTLRVAEGQWINGRVSASVVLETVLEAMAHLNDAKNNLVAHTQD